MVLTLAASLLALGTAAAVFIRISRMDGDWKRLNVLVPALFVLALVLFYQAVLGAPLRGLGLDWNGCRLAPLVSLTRGYSLYYPADHGPIMNLIYAPVAALAYAPVLAFRTSESIVMAGVAVSILYLAVPLFVVHWRVRGTGSIATVWTLLAFLVGFVALSLCTGTLAWFAVVHADAPTLGFGLLACACLIGGTGAPSTRRLVLASLFTALSMFAKQTSIALPLGMAAFLWVAHGRAAALRYALASAAMGFVFALLSVAVFGAGPLVFNLFTVPSRHAWQGKGGGRILWLLGELARHTAVPVLLLIPGIASLVRAVRSEPGRFRPDVAARPWTLFLLVSLAFIPTSLLSLVKVGGLTSSLHCVIYLYCAASLALLHGLSEPSPVVPKVALTATCAAVLFLSGYREAAQERTALSFLDVNPYKQAEALRQAHPGEIYFPANPLCALLAESRLDHFEHGVADRDRAGFRPTSDHVRAHLPPRVKYIAAYQYPPYLMPELIPEFRAKRTDGAPVLAGWTIYVAVPQGAGR